MCIEFRCNSFGRYPLLWMKDIFSDKIRATKNVRANYIVIYENYGIASNIKVLMEYMDGSFEILRLYFDKILYNLASTI